MSSDLVISCRGVGKAYRVYAEPTDRLKQMLLGRWRRYYREFWALRDVSFDMRRGETVGFLGRNGAGKSTLLQLVCGTLTPSEGEISIRGRISALLELGSGFNPMLPGRENIYVYGALLGLSRPEIDLRLDRILAFADIGEFVDMPVKTYSSGMMVRLAFSVAINVDPSILVIDEALAVGDARFTARCMTQLRRMQADGVSMLFVGHDTEAVRRLCTRALVLQDGRVVQRGPSRQVANWYLALVASDYDVSQVPAIPDIQDGVFDSGSGSVQPIAGPVVIDSRIAAPNAAEPPPDDIEFDEVNRTRPPEFRIFRYGDGNARIRSCHVLDANGTRTEQVALGEVASIVVDIEFVSDQAEHGIGFYVDDRLGVHVIGINTFQERISAGPVKAGDRVSYCFAFPLHIKPGTYTISPSIAYSQEEARWMDYVENAAVFTVVDPDPTRLVFGVYLPPQRVSTARRIVAASLPISDPNDKPSVTSAV